MSVELPLIRRCTWLWLALDLAVVAPFFTLRPILFPFLFATSLAYPCLPRLRWLDGRRLPRTASAVAVPLLVAAALALPFGIVLPLLAREIAALVSQVPGWPETLDQSVAPWSNECLGTELKLAGGAIGLHPLAAIFARLPCGQLVGLIGLPTALPASAAVAVAARHLLRRYPASESYDAP